MQRFNGESGKLLATIETNTVGKSAIVVGCGFVSVTTRLLPLIQIDPRTNTVRGKFSFKATDVMSIRYGGGSLWLSDAQLQRIKPPVQRRRQQRRLPSMSVRGFVRCGAGPPRN